MDINYVVNAIRVARLTKGIKQSEMADSIGVSQNYYSEIECGKRKIDLERLERIAHTLRVDYRDLLPPPKYLT
jgi:transcriptional regulator with XRE-family HTH domain